MTIKYKYLADADKRNNFNVERFLSAKLRPRPDDVYEVYEVDLPDESGRNPAV